MKHWRSLARLAHSGTTPEKNHPPMTIGGRFSGLRMCCLPDKPSDPSVSPNTQKVAKTDETDETGEHCDRVEEANSALDETSQDDDDVPW